MNWGISSIMKKLQFHKKFFIKLLKNTFSGGLIVFSAVWKSFLNFQHPQASTSTSMIPSIVSSKAQCCHISPHHFYVLRHTQSLIHLLCLFKNSENNSIHFQCAWRLPQISFDISQWMSLSHCRLSRVCDMKGFFPSSQKYKTRLEEFPRSHRNIFWFPLKKPYTFLILILMKISFWLWRLLPQFHSSSVLKTFEWMLIGEVCAYL